MFHLLKRTGKIFIGALLLTFGIIGLLLPLLPGIPFVLLGGAIISPKFRTKIGEYYHLLKEKWKQYKSSRST